MPAPNRDWELAALRDRAGDDVVCFPSVDGGEWRCVCGTYNLMDEAKCIDCGRKRNIVLAKYSYDRMYPEGPPAREAPPPHPSAQLPQSGARRKASLVQLSVGLAFLLFAAVTALNALSLSRVHNTQAMMTTAIGLGLFGVALVAWGIWRRFL